MKGGLGWNLSILGVDQNPCEFYLIFLYWEIDKKKTVSNTLKIGVYQILYKIWRFKQIIFSKYANNLKTIISQRSLSNLGLLLFLFEFNNFSFLMYIIDNIIIMSVSYYHSSGHVIQTHLLYCRSNNLSLYES